MEEVRHPIPALSPEERKRRLLALGLDEDLVPLDASPEERQAAMNSPAFVPPTETAPIPAPVPAGPAAGAVLKQPVVQVLTIIGVVAAAASAASQAGVLPAWVGALSNGVISILAVLGVASPGIRKTA